MALTHKQLRYLFAIGYLAKSGGGGKGGGKVVYKGKTGKSAARDLESMSEKESHVVIVKELGSYRYSSDHNMLKDNSRDDPRYRSLSRYQGGGYGPINELLRTGKQSSSKADEEVKGWIQHIDSAFESARPLQQDLIVRRGLGTKSTWDQMLKSGDLQVGSEVSDEAFLSTTYGKQIFEGPTAQITLPKGTKALHLDGPDDDPYEMELLLQRGLKFQVTKLEDNTIHLQLQDPKQSGGT